MKDNVLFWHKYYVGHSLQGHTKHVTGFSVTLDLGVGQRSEELLSQPRMLTFLGALLWGNGDGFSESSQEGAVGS